jgi:glutamyl-tRNA synthetase
MSKQVRVRLHPVQPDLYILAEFVLPYSICLPRKITVFSFTVEDTDQNRFVPGAETYIMEALEWLGIPPDETIGKNEKFGPYRQSERKPLYKTTLIN